MVNVSRRIAEEVNRLGGTAYYVGGFVRDRILGIENKDIDIEVHGLTEDELVTALSVIGKPIAFGRSFGVYQLSGYPIDIALARAETCTGAGHRDFAVSIDPHIGTRLASKRRDFTVNALMIDILSDEIIDHWGGLIDLENSVLRHVSDESFADDPLRVLRAAQFAARFGFNMAPETSALCRSISLDALSRERVEMELSKALLKSSRPSGFFEVLREMNQLSIWFPELSQLIDLPQDPVFHPEGDVWNHTMEVIVRAANYRDSTSNPLGFMLLALTHDFGKITTTEFIKGRYHAYRHETEGLPLITEFLARLIGEKDIRRYVLNMVPLHMKPNVAAYSRPSVKSTNRMFDEAASAEDLIYFSMCDKPVVSGTEEFSGDPDFLWERLALYEELMS